MEDLRIINIDLDKLYTCLENEMDFCGTSPSLYPKEKFVRSVSECFTIELSTEEDTTRRVCVGHDGSAQYVNIKNITLNPLTLLTMILQLADIIPQVKLIGLILILIDILKGISIELDKKQTFILLCIHKSILYGNIVNDENLYNIVHNAVIEEKFNPIEKNELYEIIKYLSDIRLIKINDGLYTINDTITWSD